MKNNMVCPGCGSLGFASKDMWDTANNLKCSECGAWSEPSRWEKVKTGAEYRADIATFRAKLAEVEQERERLIIEVQLNNDEVVRQHHRAVAAEQDRDRLAAEVERLKKDLDIQIERQQHMVSKADHDADMALKDATWQFFYDDALTAAQEENKRLKEHISDIKDDRDLIETALFLHDQLIANLESQLVAAQQSAKEQRRAGVESERERCIKIIGGYDGTEGICDRILRNCSNCGQGECCYCGDIRPEICGSYIKAGEIQNLGLTAIREAAKEER